MTQETTTAKLRNLTNEYMRNLTNQAYLAGNKCTYSMEWVKGEKVASNGKGGITRDYYMLRIWVVNKNESVQGLRVPLYVNFYPVTKEMTLEQLEYSALKELLFNGCVALINIATDNYLKATTAKHVSVNDVDLDKVIEAEEESKSLTTKSGLII